MINSQCFHPSFEQFYNKISPEVKKTLTDEQIQALRIACESHHHNRHFFRIKFSFPIFKAKLYIVLLAGRESRSKQRFQYKKGVYPLRNPINILLLLGLLIIFIISSYAILTLVLSSTFSMPTTPHPTSIPWLDNQFDCERTYRVWNDNACWDSEHSPTF